MSLSLSANTHLNTKFAVLDKALWLIQSDILLCKHSPEYWTCRVAYAMWYPSQQTINWILNFLFDLYKMISFSASNDLDTKQSTYSLLYKAPWLIQWAIYLSSKHSPEYWTCSVLHKALWLVCKALQSHALGKAHALSIWKCVSLLLDISQLLLGLKKTLRSWVFQPNTCFIYLVPDSYMYVYNF